MPSQDPFGWFLFWLFVVTFALTMGVVGLVVALAAADLARNVLRRWLGPTCPATVARNEEEGLLCRTCPKPPVSS